MGGLADEEVSTLSAAVVHFRLLRGRACDKWREGGRVSREKEEVIVGNGGGRG